jgi:uncharacterized protein (DUF3820 family)
MDDTILPFTKYAGKTFLYIYEKDPSYCKWIARSGWKSSNEIGEMFKSFCLSKFPLNTNLPTFTGNLTDRIKQLLSCNDSVVNKTLQSIGLDKNQNVFETHQFQLPQSLHTAIRKMHGKYPPEAGCFFDYLIRKLIAELTNIDMSDSRAEFVLRYDVSQEDLIDQHNIRESYRRYIDNDIPVVSSIEDIMKVSWCHKMFFAEFCKDYCADLVSLCHNIDTQDIIKFSNWIRSFFAINENSIIRLNPAMGTNGMGADADMIIGETIYDYKVSSSFPSLYEFLQLCGYASLCAINDKPIKIRRMSIINPLRQSIYSHDFGDWIHKYGQKFISLLLNDVA